MESSFGVRKNAFALFLTVLYISETSICHAYLHTTKSPKIVIVGAGPAGIAAASKLFEYGFKNVTILEAESRIGGRVFTEQIGDYLVDFGGQWVHGEEGNVAYELAYPLGLLDKSDEPYYGVTQELFDSLGNPVDDELAARLLSFYFEHIKAPDFGGNNHTYKSVGDYFEKMFDKHFGNSTDIMKEKKKYLHHLELYAIAADSAESWHDLSALAGVDKFKECPGDHIINWKTRGYNMILDVLMKRYPDPKKELPVRKNVRLNSEVILIDYLNSSGGPPVLVSTKNGFMVPADHVIVTVSLGVLKERHRLLFVPPLPDFKVKTIEGLGFGNVAKIFLLFEKPFWKLDGRRVVAFGFVWNDSERKRVEADPEKMWLLGMSGAMTVEHKPNLLELWISGKHAKAMEKLPKNKVFDHTVENLRRFLDKQFNVTKPVAMLRTQWYTNPNFRGTYSYRSLETERQKVSAEMLEKPLDSHNLTLLFAGEATSKDRFATVDGAIASGWKAANRLLDHYKKLLPVEE